MPALLIDEMYPTNAARLLRDRNNRDAVHVADIGLRAADDGLIAHQARSDDRALVTENVADFAGEPDVVLVVVLKRNLPDGGAMAPALAEILDRWIGENPQPYIGHLWPR